MSFVSAGPWYKGQSFEVSALQKSWGKPWDDEVEVKSLCLGLAISLLGNFQKAMSGRSGYLLHKRGPDKHRAGRNGTLNFLIRRGRSLTRLQLITNSHHLGTLYLWSCWDRLPANGGIYTEL